MSLQAHLVDETLLEQHVEACDVLYCDLCQVYIERHWQAEVTEDERLRREAEQDVELDEYERAEIQRDMEVDDDWNPNDETYPSRA